MDILNYNSNSIQEMYILFKNTMLHYSDKILLYKTFFYTIIILGLFIYVAKFCISKNTDIKTFFSFKIRQMLLLFIVVSISLDLLLTSLLEYSSILIFKHIYESPDLFSNFFIKNNLASIGVASYISMSVFITILNIYFACKLFKFFFEDDGFFTEKFYTQKDLGDNQEYEILDEYDEFYDGPRDIYYKKLYGETLTEDDYIRGEKIKHLIENIITNNSSDAEDIEEQKDEIFDMIENDENLTEEELEILNSVLEYIYDLECVDDDDDDYNDFIIN